MKVKNYFAGILSFFLLTASTLILFIPFFCISLLKLFPNKTWRIYLTKVLHKIATSWININIRYIDFMQFSELRVEGIDKIVNSNWYLIVANHQSGTDVIVLQYIFQKIRKLPFLTFFLKKQLKWVPILGIVWWAMEYPFMHRHSQAHLKKHPHKKGKDLKATIKATKVYKHIPISLVSFAEGTRFTDQKHKIQQQKGTINFKNLLRPKAGGLSYVIGAMHDEIKSLIDVTIVYSSNKKTLWDFFTYRIPKVKIIIKEIPIPDEFRQISLIDKKQEEFRSWLNNIWIEKDRLITKLKHQNSAIN